MTEHIVPLDVFPDNRPIIFGISQYSGQSYCKGDSLNAVFDSTARIVNPG